MDENPTEPVGPDIKRRRWLIATSVASGIGGIAAAIPFVDSLTPPANALAAGAPVKVDIGRLTEGAMLTVAWRGKPVFIVDRSPAMLESVIKATPLVADPDSRHAFSMPLPLYCQNTFRSRADHRNILVVVGVCTHLGCTPTPRFQPGLSQTCRITGQAASCVPATARPTILPDGYSATSQHRRTSTCHVTCSCRRPNC